MSQTISDLIEELEIPKEFVPAMFKAFELGGHRALEVVMAKQIQEDIEKLLKGEQV